MIQYIYLITGGAIALLLILFVLTSIRENKIRPAAISTLLLVIFAALWVVGFIVLKTSPLLPLSVAGIVLLFILLFFLPLGKTHSLRIDQITEKVDERDVAFAREEYQPGTEKHEIYYSLRPENKAIDDKLRKLPELLAPGGRFYDPVRSKLVQSVFRIIEEMLNRVDGTTNRKRIEIDPKEVTQKIKTMARRLGACEVGITELNPMFVYSHVGRGPETWGALIENRHEYALAFTFEMDYHHVDAAPRLLITEETAAQYLRGAQISIALAKYIRALGYPARAHIAGSNYQIMLPPVAHDAGLGELGRMGYLISPRYGARIRLGAITTNLPLIPDKPINFGAQDFCDQCMKCALNCPSGAIPRKGKTWVRGVEKWQLHIEKCIHYWRVLGTDCGLCMKVCPYSHPNTLVHNLIRSGIKHSAIARTLSVWGDDLFYGKKP